MWAKRLGKELLPKEIKEGQKESLLGKLINVIDIVGNIIFLYDKSNKQKYIQERLFEEKRWKSSSWKAYVLN